MAVLIGIDMGTTHIKMAAMDEGGRLLHLVRKRTPVQQPAPGRAEYDPKVIRQLVTDGLAELTDAMGEAASDVRAIGVSGMAEAGLLIDKQGTPLTHIHSWYDDRAVSYVEAWQDGDDADEIFRTTGLIPSAKCPLIKLQWIKDHDPKAFDQAWKWLHVPDFIVYTLTGEAGTDESLASRTLAYDIHEGLWWPGSIRRAGVSIDLFPDIHRGTEAVGVVTRRMSEATGLPAGIPVVVAGHDHVTGAAGVGALQEGDIVDSMGTAESMIAIRDQVLSGEMREDGYAYGRHVASGKQYVLGGFSGSGASVEWAIDRLGAPAGNQRYTWLLDLLEKAPEGPSGIVYLPYLRGNGPPGKDRTAKALLFGLTEGTDDATWMKAIIEGLACEFRRVLDDLAPARDTPVTVIGGGTRNPLWMQLKADLTSRTMVVPSVSEAVVQGAAILAGVAAGVYRHAKDGADAMSGNYVTIEPDPASVRRYDLWYNEMYLPTVRQTEQLQIRLRRFT